MRKLFALSAALLVVWSGSVQAQSYNARISLRTLISAFQVCGPPQAYQMLSQSLFQAVAYQTNGMGCYAAIAQAGPVAELKVIQRQQFPVGPLYMVRVTHQTGLMVDWFIGFNRITGKVEYLSFQNAAEDEEEATIEDGPAETANVVAPAGEDGDRSSDNRCERFPRMCPRNA